MSDIEKLYQEIDNLLKDKTANYLSLDDLAIFKKDLLKMKLDNQQKIEDRQVRTKLKLLEMFVNCKSNSAFEALENNAKEMGFDIKSVQVLKNKFR